MRAAGAWTGPLGGPVSLSDWNSSPLRKGDRPMASARDLLDRLETDLDALLDSEHFRHWLTVQARFPHYSFHNILLIAAQRPTATRVAGFHAWKALGRSVKKGERGIMILAPVPYKAHDTDGSDPNAPTRVGFRVVYVFDVAQTEGAPLPDLALHHLAGETATGTRLRTALLQLAAEEGLTVNLQATDCAAADGFYGYYDRRGQRIHIAADTPPDQVADTLAHELGHHFLGHGGHERDPRATCEVQAESFGFSVCAAAGLSTEGMALPYIASWAAGDTPAAKRQAIREGLRPVHDAVAACLPRLALPQDPAAA